MVYHEVELTCSTSSQTSLHSFAMKKVKRGTRMKTKSKVLTVIVSALLLFSFVSCVTSTNVTFYSDVEETEVYVDGQLIGTTPTTTKLSNAIWNDPTITLKKEGYKVMTTGLQKEAKGVNIVLGLLVDRPAFLWCYGPKANQNFMMIPDPNAKTE